MVWERRVLRGVLGVCVFVAMWFVQACYLDAETQCSSDQDCGGGQRCEGKLCVCPEGRTFCAKVCADTKSDAFHCGGCGVSCQKGQSCRAGTCQTGKVQCAAKACSTNEDCDICENTTQCILVGGGAGFCT
ncbi:hypothetical protein L6R29_13395 [Myxococcota bacterium]|nr:hypothetical protein [Myxococcota bacterium]